MQNKKWKFYLISSLTLIISFEVVSLILNSVFYEVKFGLNPQKVKKYLMYAPKEYHYSLKLYGDVFENKRVSHPYFGYMYNYSNFNNIDGFYISEKFKLKKEKDEFVVGFFGGSVALNLANYAINIKKMRDHFKSRIAKIYNLDKSKKIKIINFSKGGLKQPQQFLISSFFSDEVDIAINLDGYNEFSTPFPKYPTYFPSGAEFYFYTPEHKSRVQKIKTLKMFASLSDMTIDFPTFTFSQTAHFIWRVSNHYIYKKLLKLFHEIDKSYYDKTGVEEKFEAKYKEARETWEKYSLKQYKYLKLENTKSYYFLQPNQRIAGSKPFSEKEKSLIEMDENFVNFHSKLRRFVFERKKEGLPFFDLTNVYKNTKGTVYIDSCCHVNDFGNVVIINKILDTIEKHEAR
jgi:hypothetical protein